MTQVMKLEQAPVIHHQLVEMGAKVTKRIEELNIEKQLATDETVKTLKRIRAELNKEAREFEDQRKIIKNLVLNPYDQFEEVYKEEIINKYKEADKTLKTKINEFEMSIKREKRGNVIAYFEEIRDFEELDWLKFEQLQIDINLSTSEKKYKEQVLEKVKQVLDDLELINTDKYAAEILVEYKPTLNASNSIKLVRDRKQKEKEEKQRLLFERTQIRERSLRSLGFVSSDLTRTFNWIKDESLMISLSDIETLSDADWLKRYAELEAKAVIEEEKPKTLKAPVVQEPKVVTPKVEEKKEEIFEAKFLVRGTYKDLKALGEFLKSNNYEYENID